MTLKRTLSIVVALVLALLGVGLFGIQPQSVESSPAPIRNETAAFSQAIELTANRTATSKLYSLGGNRFAIDSSIAPIHYKDAGGAWQDIDNSVTVGTAPWNWQMTKDSYTTKFLNSFTNGQIIEFATQGQTINFQPMALQWTNGLNQIDQITMPQAVVASVATDTISWASAYGANTTFIWQNTPGRLVKMLKLGIPPRAPAAFILSGANPVLELNFIFAPSSGLNIWVDTAQWDSKSDLDAPNQPIFFKDAVGNTLFAFATPKIYDASGNTTAATMRLKKASNNLYVSVRVPYSWLQAATYPVTIDPTIDVDVAASGNDGGYWESWTVTETRQRIGNFYGARDAFFRFTGITITAGSTITVATFQPFLNSQEGAGGLTKIFAEDSDNPAAPISQAQQDARVRTTAGVDWDDPYVAPAGQKTSPSIAPIITELLASFTISNDAIIILWDDDGSVGSENTAIADQWNSDPSKPATLYIEYTEGGGAVAPTVTSSAATLVEETTASASGNITATGGENATSRGIQYDIDTGSPYASNVTESGSYGTGVFTENMTGLTKGELYYFRAFAANTGGTGYGSELTFLTKPDPATSFTSTDNGTTWISLSWTNGTGMDYVEVRYNTGSAPSSNTSGTLGYWNTGTTANVTGLSPNVTYYFRIWTHVTEGGLWNSADGTVTAQDTTDTATPTVTTQAASSVETTTATGNGNITATGGANATTRGVQWGTSTGVYTTNITEAGSFGTGAFTASLTGLPTGTTIYARAEALNPAGWGYGSEVTFLTKPAAPTNVAATDGTSTSNVTITWTKSTGATGYRVYRDAVDVSGLLGDVATYGDTGAAAPTITAGTAAATDGSSTAQVSLSVSGQSTSNGTTHTYKVVAVNASGNSADSATDTGYRGVGSLTYQWQVSAADSDAAYGDIGGATTASYDYTGAPAGNITAGATVATDGTSTAQVDLSLSGTTTVDGAGLYYKLVMDATGATQNSTAGDRGNRTVGALTYQWQRSSGDADADYSNIVGATSSTYSDTAAPAGTVTPGTATAGDGTATNQVVLSIAGESANDGAGRYFQSTLTSTGASNSPTASSANRGYRGVGALSYQWYRSAADSDAAYSVLSGATTDPYNDTTAPAPTITAGTATASDGSSSSFVTLSLAGETANNGNGRYFYATLSAAGAASQDTTHDRGYIGVGSLTLQWMRSAADSDASYSDIGGGTTDPYNDTGAPSNGDGRYFKAALAATGAASQNSTADRGYRAVVAVPSVTTNNATAITQTTATLSGNITNLGGLDVTMRGFEWGYGSSGNYTTNWTESGNFTIGNFTHGIDSLSANTTYYFRAFAQNSQGLGYGGEDSFTTLTNPVIPTVITSAATSVLYTTATLNGSVTDLGNNNTLERGFDWGYGSSGNYSANWTASGNWSAIGSFSRGITVLSENTTYYFRARARNSAGWGYGGELSFITLPPAYILNPPPTLIIDDLGATSVNATWTLGTGATYTMIRVKRDIYPASVTDGELFYYGGDTTANSTGYTLELSSYKFRAWGFNSDNLTYSGNHTDATIGGTGMENIGNQLANLLFFLPIGFVTVMAFVSGWLIMFLAAGLGMMVFGFFFWATNTYISIVLVVVGIALIVWPFLGNRK